MERQLREGGGIMSLSKEGIGGGDYKGIDMGSRTGFGILKKVKNLGKKAVRGVRDIVSSDLGKAAILGAAGAHAGGFGPFAKGSTMFGGKLAGIRGAGFAKGLLNPFTGDVDYTTPVRSFFSDIGTGISRSLSKPSGVLKKLTGDGITGVLGKGAALAGLSAFLTSQYGLSPEEQEEELADPEKLKSYLRVYYTNLNPNAGSEEIEEFVRQNSADGGRIGFANGPVLPPDPTQPVNPFGPKPGDFGIEEDIPIKMASNIENDKILEALFEKYLDMGLSPIEAEKAAFAEFERMSKRKEKFFNTQDRGLAAMGGKMDTPSDNAMQAAGIEGLPVRKNPAGVTELDLRKTGGFIQPVGIKEKEDDIPAMLSNNEFVFTADAVRGAGDGNVELGAQRMYDTMKRLEAGGRA